MNSFKLKNYIFLILITGRLASSKFEFKIASIHNLIKNGNNCSQLIDYFFQRANKYNSMLNAIINFNPNVMADAFRLDEYYWKHNRTFIGTLHCVPVLLKDNIDTEKMPTTAGLNVLRYSIPNKDALIVKRLKQAGALILAKTNMAELASGDQYNSETGGRCRNPFDLSKSCGVSSTGTGAGIASAMGIIGIGTDTSGSILFPACFNGLFGLRPPIDHRLMDGIISLNSVHSQDTVGPLTNNIDDLVLAYSILLDDNLNILNEFLNSDKTAKPNIGVITDLMGYFKLELSFGKFIYKVEDEIRNAINDSIMYLKNKSYNVKMFSFDKGDVQSIAGIFEILISRNCTLSCIKPSINNYFGDFRRFDVDSPYHNFEQFYSSKLLSQRWKDYFSRSLDFKDPVIECQSFFVLKQLADDLVEKWFKSNNISIILMPTVSNLNYPIDQSKDPFTTLVPLFTSASLPALNIPIGYGLNGMPIGLLLQGRLTNQQVLIDIFQIGKIFENFRASIFPPTTPIEEEGPFRDCKNASKKTHQIEFSLLFLISILVFIFASKLFP